MTMLLLAAAGRVSDTGLLTGINLTIIALAMVMVVLGMIWGMRQKAKRAASEREAVERQEQVAAQPEVLAPAPLETPATEPVAEPAPPLAEPAPPAPPVAPAPPPAVEAPVGSAAGVPLTRLKGLGPKAAALLAERGIADVAALAALSHTDAAAIDADLGAFSGRMAKDRWHEQAQLLAAGDLVAYEATFGKLGG